MSFLCLFPKLLSRPIRCTVHFHSFIHSKPSLFLGTGRRAGKRIGLVLPLKTNIPVDKSILRHFWDSTFFQESRAGNRGTCAAWLAAEEKGRAG